MSSTEYGMMQCTKCKKHTKTLSPLIVKSNSKNGKDGLLHDRLSIKGICFICKKTKSRFLNNNDISFLPQAIKDIQLNSSVGAGVIEDILPFLLKNPINNTLINNTPITSGAGLDNEAVTHVINSIPLIGNPMNNISIPNNSLINSIPLIANSMNSGEGIIEDAARTAAKFGVRQIPVLGDLAVDIGLVDGIADWVGDNIWTPFKKWISGNGIEIPDELKNKIMSDPNFLNTFANIMPNNGIISNYIKSLNDGNIEEKTLADLVSKTILKPNFHQFIKGSGLGKETLLPDAVRKYIKRRKPYRNNTDKMIEMLKGNGVDVIEI